MEKILKLKADNIFPLVSEIIARDQSTRISVTGSSMYPFLRDGIDSVELSKVNFDSLKRGDIVLIRRTDGAYVMHRILRKDQQRFYMVGDAQQWVEGPLYPSQLIAVVSAVWRDNHKILCSVWWWKLLSGLWLGMRPFRYKILAVYRRLRQLF